MDDPWSSPWATDAPASIAHAVQEDDSGIAAFPISKNATTSISNKPASSLWGTEDNGWGGWETQQRSPDDTWTAPDSDLDPWSQTTTVDTDTKSIGDYHDASKTEHVASQPESVGQISDTPPTALPTKDRETISPTITNSIPRNEYCNRDADNEHSEVETSTPTRQSKVQDLVVMYNGMAKKARSATKLSAVEDYLATEGTSKIHEEPSPIPNSSTHEESKTPTTDTHEVGAAKDETYTSATESGEESADDEAASISTTEDSLLGDAEPGAHIEPPKKIEYSIDLGLLDMVFPSTPATNTKAEVIPDMIIDDSFTQVSQRKLWYRISRFGSVRKHDQGNDDSYKHITWQASESRQKTIQIVRRWMEEDSIAGRVVLGKKASAIGASMFNWDSPEPAIEIGALLRQRKADAAPPPLPHLEVTQKPVVQVEADENSAAFAWATNTPMTPTEVVPISLPPTFVPESPIASDIASSISPPSSIWDEDSRPATAQRPSSTIPAVPSGLHISETVEDDDDDDDWGEMVSSPTILTEPTFASFEQSLKPARFSDNFQPISSSPLTTQQGWDFDDQEPFEAVQEPAPVQTVTAQPANPEQTPWSTDLQTTLKGDANIDKSDKPHPTSSNVTSALLDSSELTNILAAIPDLTYMLR